MRPKPRRHRVHPVLAIRRQPRLWWALTVGAALATGWLVSSIVADAEAVRAAWGAGETVAVARHDIEAGAPVEAGDVELVERPRALVPDDAVHDLADGQVASAAIAAGEVVVADRLAPLGLRGVAATLPPGARAVAIPVEPGQAPPLTVGDHVDVLVALAPEAAGDGPPGFVVAAGAVVVAVEDTAVTVAVRSAAAPRIAVALGQGAVTLALIGP
jgi:Flp pilus assembly protein CpaB